MGQLHIALALLTGCVSPQEAIVEMASPPATMPEASEIDSIEVVFGDQTRVVTDRTSIEGFVSFVISLDTGWKDVSGYRAGPAMGWKIYVNSGGKFVNSADEEKVAFAYFAEYFIWHAFPSPTEHIYRGRELNQSERERLYLLLDLESDLSEMEMEATTN